jgi:hypothetical protein
LLFNDACRNTQVAYIFLLNQTIAHLVHINIQFIDTLTCFGATVKYLRTSQKILSKSTFLKICCEVPEGLEGGTYPLRLPSRAWLQAAAAGGTVYQFMYFLILRRNFWTSRMRVDWYEGETRFLKI